MHSIVILTKFVFVALDSQPQHNFCHSNRTVFTRIYHNIDILQSKSSATPLYENTLFTVAGERSRYGNVKMSKHEPAAQYEEIDLSTNVAYGRIQR